MPDADSEPDVDHETWKVDMNLTYSMIIGILIFLVFSGLLKYFVGKYRQKVGDFSRHVLRRYIEPVLLIIPGVKGWIGAEFKVKLLFVPDADNKPEEKHEISEPALFRFLINEEIYKKINEAGVRMPEMLNVLKDIDRQSKIIQVEAYQSSMMKASDKIKKFHVFIVFKSTSVTDEVYWWSLEKGLEYIVLQRSRNKENVKDKLDGQTRDQAKPIKEDLKGKGTIQDLFEILWANQKIAEKYNIFYSNCQSLVTFVGQQITEIGYKYKGKSPFSAPRERGWNQKMLDFIKILRGLNSCDCHPLFQLLLLGNTDLVDKMIKSGKYDIDASCNGLTPLHFAIMDSKTKMVKHLLEPPLNADPTRRDKHGWSALLWAAMITMKAEIFDWLLAHSKVKVDDVGEHGETALHLAALASNVVAAQKLLEKGANPNIFANKGVSPLHVAATQSDGDAMFDLLLAHDKINVDDVDEHGFTALHWAALASNVIAVQKLLEKGANPNAVGKSGDSPLHVAATQRDGIPIIDLLLEAQKVKGLGDVNDRDKEGWTALHYAAAYSNEITAEHLIKKGADLHCRDNDGLTPLDMAALGAINMKIIDLLLQNINQGEIEQYLNDERLFFCAMSNVLGLEMEIGERLVKKGIKPPSTETDEVTEESDEETPLFFAIRANNVTRVRTLLERGADHTIRNNKGLTPFHLAAGIDRDSEILKLLLDSGKVDINETTTEYGRTALHIAIATPNVTAARFLLSKGANPNVADKYGWTPLHFATKIAKDLDIVELLLDHKDVDVNRLDKWGKYALYYATFNETNQGEKIVNRLKEKGAVDTANGLPKVNNEFLKKRMRTFGNQKPSKLENILSDDTVPIEDKLDRISGEFPASAITGLNVETLRRLLKNGADISRARGEYGMNALHLASIYANTTDLIEFIRETREFDINGIDNDGNAPLHYAIVGSNVTTACYLLEKGADPTIRNNEGLTPLHLVATYAKEMDIVKLLVNHKDTNVNYLDNEGNNALHYAMDNDHGLAEEIANLLKGKTVLLKAEGNNHEPENIAALVDSHMKTIRLLIEDGQDITAMTWGENGANALHLAAAGEETTDLINAFLETGEFDINGGDNDGWTPLHYAITGSNATTNVPHLIQLGADPSSIANNTNKVTPLHLAAKNEETAELIDTILKTGQCDINGVDSDGRTPLYYAIKRPDPVSTNVRHLIEMGADPGIADRNRVTLLHLAAIYAESMDLIELLLNTKKLDVTDCDDNGLTARDYARYNKHGLGDTIVDRLTKNLLASRIKVLVCLCWIFCFVFLLAVYIVEA
ncbi:serine/threonine-protein phosphatase 6 regulatory ankyrin repeat subunit A-like [Daphnia pulicaria]|uniref:serine/threonine-protein phosphatase 6 regulatory ankyrin repeat subunit A-like n=1 Tax=Daphnia pulicaria TaxID=35523 RepID=UPI001EECD0D8|nr:serine/threonine-protein phosphatase 6 regulatory ankyrin repeat subunit A-like [Daphnia pulicaria]